jgi:two-component system, OmpR family, sensor histidine kinase KdpD
MTHHPPPESSRADPARLLAKLEVEAKRVDHTRALLRIYVGAAPGVGKTYAMLNEGQRRRSRGTDVAIACLQTGARPLTAEMAVGLEAIPCQVIRDSVDPRSDDLDVPAILARHPAVVLVDELAHVNHPAGSRQFRWQDVQELLDAGITVITTMNVWDLESLKSQAESILGREVQSTVPDWFVEQADDIELIDMAPEALRSRLRHGNVYPPEQIESELNGLFRQDRLAALRQLALNLTAREVNQQLDRYMREHEIAGWRVDERVLVCIDHHSIGRILLERGRRMASGFRCPLQVVSVRRSHLRPGQERTAEANVRYARELGAQVREIEDRGAIDAIARLAAELRITQLVLGHARRPAWQEWLLGAPIRRLIRLLPDVDVHIIAESASPSGKDSVLPTAPALPAG